LGALRALGIKRDVDANTSSFTWTVPSPSQSPMHVCADGRVMRCRHYHDDGERQLGFAEPSAEFRFHTVLRADGL
jgi:hypothetical protein